MGSHFGSSAVENSQPLLTKTTFSFSNNGQSHEGNESDGSHEGHEGHEEEGSEQDCEGQTRKVGGLPWHQGQDLLWTVQDRLDQEQEWQDCEQEDVSKGQEGLRPHQGLDCCCPEGQEGQGALPVSSTHKHTKASAQGVGMSTALERSC